MKIFSSLIHNPVVTAILQNYDVNPNRRAIWIEKLEDISHRINRVPEEKTRLPHQLENPLGTIIPTY